MLIHSLYNKPPSEGIEFTEPSMAQQHFANEVDINTMMQKYLKTGVLFQKQGGEYGDVFEAPSDYREAMDFILNAQERFLELPAIVRKRFGNDPAQLLDFLSDKDNTEEAVRLGLIPKEALDQVSPGEILAPSGDAGVSSEGGQG